MAEGDRLMRFQQSPLDNWISNAIHVCTNDKKPEQIRFYAKRPNTIAKMNDNINMDRTIAGSMNARC